MKKIKWIVPIIMIMMVMAAGCGSDTSAEESAEEQSADEGAQSDAIRDDKETSDAETEAGQMSAASLDPKEQLKTDIAGMRITFRFDEAEEVLNGEEIAGWLTDLPDGSISVNEAPAKEYVASLAKKYDTFGQTSSFMTHAGETINVSGGDYGYWMDRVSTRQELIDQIMTGQRAELTPVYYGTASKYGSDDIGTTYVEINLEDQHLWVYQDGSVINESDFVSGGLFKGNNTPDGTYAITYKERDATLVGQGYESSVKYWMPFNGNIGMHDASWRSAFGGHIYYMNGSHGCINLPSEKAKEIFDQVEKGEPVVVYGGITKEQAVATLSLDEKIQAAQKGYIAMTPELQAKIYEQQGLDPATAAAQAQAQQLLQQQMEALAQQQAALAEAAQNAGQ